ncbi:MAG TPA: hypothetical protein VMW08_00775 [Acidimicrobiales bacterium]|nr:hypothetical protein [Acidimicrobiales bacterium]
MPTGYTESVQKGEVTELAVFAIECARAFGALVTMRDAPTGTPIPDEFQPSSHYRDRIAELETELAEVEGWSHDQAADAAMDAFTAEVDRRRERREREAEEEARYEAMLAKVEAWTPPTLGHRELKTFMVDQLTESIRFDCSTLYPADGDPKRAMSPEEYRAMRRTTITDQLERARDEWVKEQRRASDRTRWVNDLRASLKESVNG